MSKKAKEITPEEYVARCKGKSKGNMIKYYRLFSAAEQYIIGYTHKHKLYFTIVDEIMPKLLNVEIASRQCGYNLRLRVHKEDKIKLLPYSIEIGTDEDLIDTVGHYNEKGEFKHWNKGEMFEKLVTEYYGQVWEKDTIGFWKQGDININGVEVQIKLQDATLVSTMKLHELQKGMA